VALQAELVELREIKADYEQMAQQLGYINRVSAAQRQYKRADVIGRDTTGLLRTVTISLGTRDGIAVGMPVVTELGLVGRVSAVTAISAQVRLIIDPGSFVNARLQDTRQEGQVVPGSIQGTSAGDLRMTFIPLPVRDSDRIADGEVVITSGIGGSFPRGIIIGQVTSSRLDDSRLFQEAEVRSLVNFSRLEYVLVITNFEPIDISDLPTP
jgi:rod shape-determining protein MreC